MIKRPRPILTLLAAVGLALLLAPDRAHAASADASTPTEATGKAADRPPMLERIVSLEAVDLPLVEALGQLRDQAATTLVFDESVALQRRISFEGRGPLAEILRRVMAQEGLGYERLRHGLFGNDAFIIFVDSPEKRWAFSADNPMNGQSERLTESLGTPKVDFDHEGVPLLDLFGVLEAASKLHFRFDVDVDLEEKVTLVLDALTVQETLDLLMLRYGLTYQLRDETLILVYPGSFEKMKRHDDPRLAGVSMKGPGRRAGPESARD